MKTPFTDLQGRIDETQKLLATMSEFTEAWTQPGFQAIDLPDGPDFPRLGATKEDLAKRLLDITPDAEVDYQISMVLFCLNQMTIANDLIELQNCYKLHIPHADWSVVDKTIDADDTRFNTLVANAGDLRKQREQQPYDPLDEESYRDEFLSRVSDNADAQQGKIRWSFRYAMQADQVLDTIFEKRLDALELSMAANKSLTERIAQHLEDYAIIRISVDEGIVDPSETLDTLEAEKIGFCKKMLPRAHAGLHSLQQFKDDLLAMGAHDKDYENFAVKSYTPLSIKGLPQFTP